MMTDRTTINVSKEAHREAQAAKEEGETWSDYLLRSTDVEAVSKDDRGELIEDIRGELETLNPEYERPEKQLDEGEIARMVVSDLEGSLPRKIAEELHG